MESADAEMKKLLYVQLKKETNTERQSAAL